MLPILVLIAAAALVWPPSPAGADEAPEAPVEEEKTATLANRLLARDEPGRAVRLCLAHLSPDSSDAELRAMLSRAYVARDRVCLPLPPAAEAFQFGSARCDLTIVPPATRDTIQAVFRTQMALAPEDPQSYLLIADHELRFGTTDGLSRVLEGLARFDQPETRETIRSHLMAQLPAGRRPPTAAVLASHLLSDPDILDCTEIQRLIPALLMAGDFTGVVAAIGRIPADSLCNRQVLSTATTALLLGGFYQELWDYTKSVTLKLDTVTYYQYVLTAVLAAAHFDPAKARKRLAHERINEEAYPEEARRLMAEIAALIDDPGAPAKRWADLVQDSLFVDDRFREVRFLLHSLAVKRDPRYEPSNSALAEDLLQRQLPLLAAFRFEDLAGGRNPDLDRRWDPRRPRFLRRAAECHFAAEDDESCLTLLAAIPERIAEDELMAGVAALRGGDREAAGAALERARGRARVPAMAAAAERLLAMTAAVAP